MKAPDYKASLQQLTSDDRMQYLASSVPSSSVYKSLQNRLLQSTSPDERTKLAANMERSRWQVTQPADRSHQDEDSFAHQHHQSCRGES